MNFPKKLFVKIEGGTSEQYFSASADAEVLVDIGDRVKIATYHLVTVEIGEAAVKLTPLPKKK
jgi:hypothetical protein